MGVYTGEKQNNYLPLKTEGVCEDEHRTVKERDNQTKRESEREDE